MSARDPYLTSVTPVAQRLYVLTADGDIRRVTHIGVRPSGATVPVASTPDGFRFIHAPVHAGTWLACHIARLRGAHIPKPEPIEHLDEVTDARGTMPAAIVPLSVIPNHRRPKTARTVTGKDT
ncbi:hypothetical protein [Mycobacteroides abscessus]|uniref:hypothetical protein n=1 Tax=Mycobacteroides abscessus TaxID=36809 RepID=UPI0019D2EA10|nr:hypothetical protein [Mycobacteroides abscessus]MBN7481026.1 hypothetical protein [Mycobacteroides abscessus subsp. massiliense]